jgi:hypothetical protein
VIEHRSQHFPADGAGAPTDDAKRRSFGYWHSG